MHLVSASKRTMNTYIPDAVRRVDSKITCFSTRPLITPDCLRNRCNTTPSHSPPASSSYNAMENTYALSFIRRSYKEDKYRTANTVERALGVILSTSHSKWHLTVTFAISKEDASRIIPKLNVKERREDFESFCRGIDYDKINLLNDTVTQLLISRDRSPEWEVLPVKAGLDKDGGYGDSLWLCVREDPTRVLYPVYNDLNVSTLDSKNIKKEDELAPGVFRARVDGDGQLYAYKEIERPFYQPRDSQVLEQELLNLVRLQGVPGIVQLRAAVVSQNPYDSSGSEKATIVLRGFLLVYYPHGTLEHAFKNSALINAPWAKWSFQITKALAELHLHGITHMDMKPSNIVIDGKHNAVIIDISGIGGVSQEWLAPEMRDVHDPISVREQFRTQNDVWALGCILSNVAEFLKDSREKNAIERVALEATAEEPASRISLHQAICELSNLYQNCDQSMPSVSKPPSKWSPTEHQQYPDNKWGQIYRALHGLAAAFRRIHRGDRTTQ